MIDAFVDKIVVHKDYFEWHLFFDDTAMMKVAVEGNKRNHDISCETALDVNGSTKCSKQISTFRKTLLCWVEKQKGYRLTYN